MFGMSEIRSDVLFRMQASNLKIEKLKETLTRVELRNMLCEFVDINQLHELHFKICWKWLVYIQVDDERG